ncbi:MAG: hypothetical protein EOO68_05320 [Moraxellaceae bacterium]|nr:MAG: hypothetical protein EOO68_05320 [Moraxellaceae bacterium]
MLPKTCLLLLSLLAHSLLSFAQPKTPADFGYRHLRMRYQRDTVNILVLSKKGEAKDDEKEEVVAKSESVKASSEKNQKVATKTEALKEGEFISAQQLQSVKFALMEKLSLECARGFVVEGERYLPIINSKVMKLELIYHCL